MRTCHIKFDSSKSALPIYSELLDGLHSGLMLAFIDKEHTTYVCDPKCIIALILYRMSGLRTQLNTRISSDSSPQYTEMLTQINRMLAQYMNLLLSFSGFEELSDLPLDSRLSRVVECFESHQLFYGPNDINSFELKSYYISFLEEFGHLDSQDGCQVSHDFLSGSMNLERLESILKKIEIDGQLRLSDGVPLSIQEYEKYAVHEMTVLEFLLHLLFKPNLDEDLKDLIVSKLISTECLPVKVVSCKVIQVPIESKISPNQSVIESSDTQQVAFFYAYDLFKLLTDNSIDFYLSIDLPNYLSQLFLEIISDDTCFLTNTLKQELDYMQLYYCSLELTDDQRWYLLDSFNTMSEIIDDRYPKKSEMMNYFYDILVQISSELSPHFGNQLSRSMRSSDFVDFINVLLDESKMSFSSASKGIDDYFQMVAKCATQKQLQFSNLSLRFISIALFHLSRFPSESNNKTSAKVFLITEKGLKLEAFEKFDNFSSLASLLRIISYQAHLIVEGKQNGPFRSLFWGLIIRCIANENRILFDFDVFGEKPLNILFHEDSINLGRLCSYSPPIALMIIGETLKLVSAEPKGMLSYEYQLPGVPFSVTSAPNRFAPLLFISFLSVFRNEMLPKLDHNYWKDSVCLSSNVERSVYHPDVTVQFKMFRLIEDIMMKSIRCFLGSFSQSILGSYKKNFCDELYQYKQKDLQNCYSFVAQLFSQFLCIGSSNNVRYPNFFKFLLLPVLFEMTDSFLDDKILNQMFLRLPNSGKFSSYSRKNKIFHIQSALVLSIFQKNGTDRDDVSGFVILSDYDGLFQEILEWLYDLPIVKQRIGQRKTYLDNRSELFTMSEMLETFGLIHIDSKLKAARVDREKDAEMKAVKLLDEIEFENLPESSQVKKKKSKNKKAKNNSDRNVDVNSLVIPKKDQDCAILRKLITDEITCLQRLYSDVLTRPDKEFLQSISNGLERLDGFKRKYDSNGGNWELEFDDQYKPLTEKIVETIKKFVEPLRMPITWLSFELEISEDNTLYRDLVERVMES